MERFSENFSETQQDRIETEPKSISVTEGVIFAFEQNPELAEIGTKEEYAEYLKSVFPDSKFQEVVYHGSDAEFKNDGFKPMNPNFDTLNSIAGVYNFTSDRDFAKRYGKNTYAAILNLQHPLEESTAGDYADDMDRPLSEAMFRSGKRPADNPFAPKYDEVLKDTDGLINRISGENYIARHPKSGSEIGIPKQDIVSVFDNSQIHILGSESDRQKFQEYVKQKTG